MLRLSGRRASLSRENPFNNLGMQVAFVLPFSMLLLVPVGFYNLNWVFPALMVLLGAHYLPFDCPEVRFEEASCNSPSPMLQFPRSPFERSRLRGGRYA